MVKGKFEKEACDVQSDLVDLENKSDYFLYFYKMEGCTKIVLSDSVKEEDVIRVCNEAIDAIVDFKRDFNMMDGKV